MGKIKIIFILSILLTFFGSNPVFSMSFAESIGYARDNESSTSSINTYYTPDIGTLSDSNNITRAAGNNTQVLMTNWSKSPFNYNTRQGQTQKNTGYDMWLSPAQQLPALLYAKGVTNGSNVHTGVAQALGLTPDPPTPPTPINDFILEIWATNNTDILQRPTLNPAINSLPISNGLTAENLNILSNALPHLPNPTWQNFFDTDDNTLASNLVPAIKSNMAASGTIWTDAQALTYAKFLVGQAKWAYNSGTNGAPWSGLGYTYNWGAGANAFDPQNWGNSIRGTSEYIQLKGDKEFTVAAMYSEQSYIYRVKSPVAGDPSTWNNGDFKITGDCNTLWTGRWFQPNGNSIEVTSTGNMAGGEGILVTSLGYTLNNAGTITSDPTKKKFNIDGSDYTTILFLGEDSNALSKTNTIINSGVIGSMPVYTAIEATGDTSITNSGTIIGDINFNEGKGTITAKGGTTNNCDVTMTTMGNNAITLNDITITGDNEVKNTNNIGTLNIHAADISVGGTTKVYSDYRFSTTLNIDSDTATFNRAVDIDGENSRLISNGTTIFNRAVTVNDGVLSLYGRATMPTLNIGSTLDMLNGSINTITSGTTTLNDNVNLYIDATPNTNDIFNTTGTLTTNGHNFVLKGINLLSTPQDASFTINNVVQAGTVTGTLKIDTTQLPVINTAIGTYSLSALDGSLFASLTDFNPQVFRGQVATEAAYANQLITNDVLFTHVDLINKQLLAADKPNVYAAENPLFAPYQYSKKEGGLWYKAYSNIERLQLTQGLNTQNNMWGSLIGADFPLVKLKYGWSVLPTAYIGYTGAYQTFSGVNMYQNGGQGGIMGTFYKNNFITSLLANVGGYGNDMFVAGTKDITGNWFAGIASKSAYNIGLPKDFILQPTMLLSYNAFGPQSWSTSFGNTSMLTNFFNGFNLAPGLNLILNKETWSVYATTQLMFNVINGSSGRVGNINLPTVRMGATYFQYGLGFTKIFKGRLSMYGQILFSNGVRTGVGFQGGLEWRF